MEVTIDKNIPLTLTKKTSKGLTAVFRKLEINDSLVLPLKKRNMVYNLAIYARIKIATRTISETEIRVWRVA